MTITNTTNDSHIAYLNILQDEWNAQSFSTVQAPKTKAAPEASPCSPQKVAAMDSNRTDGRLEGLARPLLNYLRREQSAAFHE